MQTVTGKEDELNAALSARARRGDYDDGKVLAVGYWQHRDNFYPLIRPDIGAIGT